MANKGNGIIIDVGFRADWQKIIKEIETEFGNLNLGKKINIEGAIGSQLDNVKAKIASINKDINSLLNNMDSADTFKSVASDIDLIKHAIKELSDGVKSAGGNNSALKQLNNQLSSAQKLASDTAEVIESAQKNLGKTKLIDTSETKEQLKEIIELKKRLDDTSDENRYKSYKNAESALTDMTKCYQRLIELDEQYYEVDNNKSLSKLDKADQLSEIVVRASQVSTALSNAIDQYDSFKSKIGEADKIKFDGLNESISEFANSMADLFSEYRQEVINQLDSLYNELNKPVEKTQKEKKSIRIPLELDKEKGKGYTGTKLWGEVNEVITKIQKELYKTPLEVQIKLESQGRARGTQTLLNQIKEEIGNIGDGEASAKLNGLIDKLNKRVENALLFNVEVNTDVASEKVNDFIEETKIKLKSLKKAVPSLKDVAFEAIDKDVIDSYAQLSEELTKIIDQLTKLATLIPAFNNSVSSNGSVIEDQIVDIKNMFNEFDQRLDTLKTKLGEHVGIDLKLTSPEQALETLTKVKELVDTIPKSKKIKLNISVDGLEQLEDLKKYLLGEQGNVKTQTVFDAKELSNRLKSATNTLKKIKTKTVLDKSLDPTSFPVKIVPDVGDFAKTVQESLKDITIPIAVYISEVDLKNSADALKVPVNNLVKQKSTVKSDIESKAEKEVEALKKVDKYIQKNTQRMNELSTQKIKTTEGLSDNAELNVLSRSIEATKNGLIEIKTLIVDAEGNYKQFTHESTNGQKLLNKEIVDSSAAIQKQGMAIEKLNAKRQEQTILVDTTQVLKDNNESWQRASELAERYEIDLTEISQIIRNIDKEGHESFQFFNANDNSKVTLGYDSEGILYFTKTITGATDAIGELDNAVNRMGSAYKKALSGDSLSTGRMIDNLQLIFALIHQIQDASQNGFVSDEAAIRVSQLQERLKSFFENTFTDENLSKQLTGKTSEYINEVKTQANALSNLFEDITSNERITEEQIEVLTNATAQFGKTLKEASQDSNKLAKETKIVSLIKSITSELDKNSAMSSSLKGDFMVLFNELSSGAELSQERIKEITVQLMKLQSQVQVSGKTGLGFVEKIKKAVNTNLTQYIARFFSLYDIIRYVRTVAGSVIDLDTALVDLKKTTTMTTDELEQFYYASNDIAKQMGVTTKQIIEQAAVWSRLGYSTKEASEQMAALSSQFKVISPGMSLENATDGLVSTMQAFHIKVEDAEREIMDSINRVGNTMATSNDEIVEMLKRSSAAMYEANNTLAETIALESAAVQITRNAQTTGTAFRTEFVHVYSNVH